MKHYENRILRLPFLLIAVFAFTFLQTACNREPVDEPGTNPGALKLGTVTGEVFSLNGNRPIGNANVFIDHQGEIYITQTDAQGRYSLDAPEGVHTLNIQTGYGDIFRTATQVTVKPEQTTTIPSGQAVLRQNAGLAYIPGAFDNIETILVDTLGYSATQLSVADLDNPGTLDLYAAIFLNCGKSGLMDSAKYANLYNYVLDGGSLYASDWAVEYLTGDGNFRFANLGGGIHQVNLNRHDAPGGVAVNQRTAACSSPEVGGFIADSELCSDKMGSTGLVPAASVVAADIQTVTGPDMDVEYDLGAWEVIGTLGQDWEVLVQDNNMYGPLAIRLDVPGSTTVWDPLISNSNGGGNGTGSGNGWVTICHIPPGNPGNPVTITVSTAALAPHLAHGDQIGPCGGGNGARIYYTTFHNHYNTGVSGDMKAILEYFVLNL